MTTTEPAPAEEAPPPDPNAVNITINGVPHVARKGQMLIDAAADAGQYIPRFCYHERMTPVGKCRMCLVECDSGRGPAVTVSCMVPVAPDMKVDTESPTTKRMQEGILELLLASAGVNYLMGIPLGDDVMLNYNTTSFHNNAQLREVYGLRPTPEFEAWLERIGLVADADRPAGELPYGAQRRLEIARAMCTEPNLLCLDEPAAGLNPRESAELNALLTSIRDRDGVGVLLIEHDMSVVMKISDHVVVLDYGKLIADGTPEDVRNNPRVIAAYLGVEDKDVAKVEASGAQKTQLPGAPWALVPPDVRRDFERVARAGPPLASTAFGRPVLGVKTGCNDAFIVRVLEPAPTAPHAPTRSGPADDSCRVVGQDATGTIERALLRPLLRGDGLSAWRRGADDARIIWTHDATGDPLDRLPPAAVDWLRPWSRRLATRTDAQGRGPWWQLFRTEAASMNRPRVVWGDIGRAPRASVVPSGDPAVPLNSCYVLFAPTEDDAHALATLLNAPPLVAWLRMIAEPARGGYHRFLGWTVARLPIPRDWSGAVERLAPIGRAAAAGAPPDAATLTAAVLACYHIRPRDVSALLTWTHS